MLDPFETEVFDVACGFWKANADRLAVRLRDAPSSENFLSHLFARAFDEHRFICVREVPYVDLGSDTPTKAGLDLMVISPDKTRSTLIEAKLVREGTRNFYRARAPKNGSSIAGDASKLLLLPPKPGRSRLLMVIMVSLSGAGSPAEWTEWLMDASPLRALGWFRIDLGVGPLFRISDKGWLDILIYKVV